MKALVVNAVGRGFDFEDVQIATPIGREVLVDVLASGLCHTDRLLRCFLSQRPSLSDDSRD